MYNIAYVSLYRYTTSLIKDTARRHQYKATTGPELRDWDDEELLRIRVVLRRITALRVANPEDGEDLVQETLLTMAAKRSRVDIQKGLLIWGLGILRNKIGNYYRRSQRLVSFEDCGSFGRDAGIQAIVEPSQEAKLHYSEMSLLVDKILATFAPREREVLSLYLAGVPTSEIVDIFHTERYQNIVNWLHRGRKKLARELAKYGYVKPGSNGRR